MCIDVITLGIATADVMVRPVDAFPERGTTVLIPHAELHLGGLAAATSIVLCQLGASAAFVGCIGEDSFGSFIAHTLESKGVDVGHLRRTDECSSASTVVLISEDGERSFLHHVGANALLCEADVDFDAVAQAKILHWGGPSLTPGLDGEPIGRVMAKARAAGVTTSVDTCFDAGGRWFAHIEHALPHLDIVMSSLEEARHYTGQREPEDIADAYLSHGPETVMIKLGGDGLFVKNSQEAHYVAPHEVPVIDTTGAGDAACAGFLYGQIHGWDLLRCGQLANAVGALTVQVMGGAEAIESLDAPLALMGGREATHGE